MVVETQTSCLDGGFKHFLFSPLPGEMIQFDQYFSKGLKPPTGCEFHQKIPWGWLHDPI